MVHRQQGDTFGIDLAVELAVLDGGGRYASAASG